jgi:hypothetical protein
MDKNGRHKKKELPGKDISYRKRQYGLKKWLGLRMPQKRSQKGEKL